MCDSVSIRPHESAYTCIPVRNSFPLSTGCNDFLEFLSVISRMLTSDGWPSTRLKIRSIYNSEQKKCSKILDEWCIVIFLVGFIERLSPWKIFECYFTIFKELIFCSGLSSNCDS